jgi:hypothetical protein
MNELDIQAARAALQQFQDGYTRRQADQIEAFRGLFVPEDDLEIIGTAAVDPGDDEWCLGADAASELFINDWSSWGDLVLDVADARIHVLGEVAWLATTGTVHMDLDPDETCRDILEYIREEVTGDDESHPRERLLEILRGAANTLVETGRGEDYIWPLRFTAVLVRRGGRWLFHQVQFSFATTRYPDVRN